MGRCWFPCRVRCGERLEARRRGFGLGGGGCGRRIGSRRLGIGLGGCRVLDGGMRMHFLGGSFVKSRGGGIGRRVMLLSPSLESQFLVDMLPKCQRH